MTSQKNADVTFDQVNQYSNSDYKHRTHVSVIEWWHTIRSRQTGYWMTTEPKTYYSFPLKVQLQGQYIVTGRWNVWYLLQEV